MKSFMLFAFLCSASFGEPLFKAETINPDGSDRPVLVVTLANGQKILSKKSIYQAEATKLSIKNNILIMSYEGGARSKWTDVLKWRLNSKKKDFVLIGRTYDIEDTGGNYPSERFDANYVIGNLDRTVGKKKKSCSFKSKKTYLTTYDFPDDKDDSLKELEKACSMKIDRD